MYLSKTPNYRAFNSSQHLIRLHRLPISPSRILMEPFLELHFEMESAAEVMLKEGSKFLGAYDPFWNHLIQRSRNVFLPNKHWMP